MKRFVIGVCLVGLFALVGLVSSCGAPTFSLDIYYPARPGSTSSADFQPPKLQQLHFFLRGAQQQPGWTAVLNSGDLNLPSIPCSEKHVPAKPGFIPGTLTSLAPYVELFGFDGEVSTQGGSLPPANVTGRFPREIACQEPAAGASGRKVSVFLSPPGTMTFWNGSNASSLPEGWAQRVGHQVTRLANGRYLISGGTRNLAIPGSGVNDAWNAEWNTDLAVYNPNTGEIERFELGIKRAFHSAIWRKNKLYFSGGLTEDSNGQVVLAEKVDVLDYAPETNSWTLRAPTQEEAVDTASLPKRAFHKTLQLPVEGQAGVFQHVFLGGLSVLPPNEPTEQDGLQVLFHSVTEVPAGSTGGRSVLMLGGAYRMPDGRFLASQAGLGFEVNAKGSLEPLDTGNKIPAVLHTPRAGHTATALSSDLVLVVGGIQGQLRGEKQWVNTMEFIRRDGSTWSPVAECSSKVKDYPDLIKRTFATATVLREKTDQVEILIAGGIGPSQQPLPSMIVVWKRSDTEPLCGQLRVRVLEEPSSVLLHGMHSATLLETGQVMVIGGAVLGPNALTLEGQAMSAWFNPGSAYSLVSMASTTEPGNGESTPTEPPPESPTEGSDGGPPEEGGAPEDGGSPEIPEPPPVDEPPPLSPSICSSKSSSSGTRSTCGFARTLRNTDNPSDPTLGSNGSIAIQSGTSTSHYIVASSHKDTFRECPAPFPVSRGLRDILVAKFTSEGQCVWATNAGGKGDDEAISVTVDAAGSIYVTGYITGQATFGSLTVGDPNASTRCQRTDPKSQCLVEMFVAKLSTNGKWEWATAVTGLGYDLGQSIAVGGQNDLYVTGLFSGDATRKLTLSGLSAPLQNHGSYGLFVAKMDTQSGKWVWANTAQTSGGASFGSHVVVSPDSRAVYITGGFYGKQCTFAFRSTPSGPMSTKTLNNSDQDLNNPKDEAFVARLDSSGVFTNIREIMGSGRTRASSLHFLPAGTVANGLYVVGSFQGKVRLGRSEFSTKINGAYDSYVYRLTGTLEPVAARQIPAINSQAQQTSPVVAATDVFVSGEDVYVVGTFGNALGVGDVNARVAAGKENGHIWLARLGADNLLMHDVRLSSHPVLSSFSSEIALGLAFDPNAKAPVVLGYRMGTASFSGQPCTSPNTNSPLIFFWKSPSPSCSWGRLSNPVAASIQVPTTRKTTWLGKDTKGNLYAVGYFSGVLQFGGSTRSCKSEDVENMFLAKWNSQGSLLWLRCWGGKFSTKAEGAVLDSNGTTLWVTGSFSNTFEATINKSGSITQFERESSGGTNSKDKDILLAAVDTGTGDFTQIHTGGSRRDDEGRDVAVNGNRVFVTGYIRGAPTSNSRWDAGLATQVIDGQQNAVVGIFPKNNIVKPTAVIPIVATSRNASTGSKLRWSGQGTRQLYVIGHFSGALKSDIFKWGANQGRSLGRTDIFVAAIDDNGRPKWSLTFGGNSDDFVHGIEVTRTGGLILGGEFNQRLSLGTQTLQSRGKRDGFVMALDSKGTPQILFNLGGTGDDSITALALDSSENLFVGGTFAGNLKFQGPQGSTITFFTPTKRNLGSFLMQFTSQASFQWLWTFGEASFLRAELSGLCVDNSSIYMSGTIREPTYLPPRIYRHPGSSSVSLGRMLYLNKVPTPSIK